MTDLKLKDIFRRALHKANRYPTKTAALLGVAGSLIMAFEAGRQDNSLLLYSVGFGGE